jgi:hypothetical protein
MNFFLFWIACGVANCKIRHFTIQDWKLAAIAFALGPILTFPLLVYEDMPSGFEGTR